MKKRTVNAIKKAVLIAGIPFTLCTIIITVVFIVVMRRDQIHGIELLYWFLDYAFDYICLLWMAAFTVFILALYFYQSSSDDE